jgi:hypothetical protein
MVVSLRLTDYRNGFAVGLTWFSLLWRHGQPSVRIHSSQGVKGPEDCPVPPNPHIRMWEASDPPLAVGPPSVFRVTHQHVSAAKGAPNTARRCEILKVRQSAARPPNGGNSVTATSVRKVSITMQLITSTDCITLRAIFYEFVALIIAHEEACPVRRVA